MRIRRTQFLPLHRRPRHCGRVPAPEKGTRAFRLAGIQAQRARLSLLPTPPTPLSALGLGEVARIESRASSRRRLPSPAKRRSQELSAAFALITRAGHLHDHHVIQKPSGVDPQPVSARQRDDRTGGWRVAAMTSPSMLDGMSAVDVMRQLVITETGGEKFGNLVICLRRAGAATALPCHAALHGDLHAQAPLPWKTMTALEVLGPCSIFQGAVIQTGAPSKRRFSTT